MVFKSVHCLWRTYRLHDIKPVTVQKTLRTSCDYTCQSRRRTVWPTPLLLMQPSLTGARDRKGVIVVLLSAVSHAIQSMGIWIAAFAVVEISSIRREWLLLRGVQSVKSYCKSMYLFNNTNSIGLELMCCLFQSVSTLFSYITRFSWVSDTQDPCSNTISDIYPAWHRTPVFNNRRPPSPPTWPHILIPRSVMTYDPCFWPLTFAPEQFWIRIRIFARFADCLADIFPK